MNAFEAFGLDFGFERKPTLLTALLTPAPPITSGPTNTLLYQSPHIVNNVQYNILVVAVVSISVVAFFLGGLAGAAIGGFVSRHLFKERSQKKVGDLLRKKVTWFDRRNCNKGACRIEEEPGPSNLSVLTTPAATSLFESNPRTPSSPSVIAGDFLVEVDE